MIELFAEIVVKRKGEPDEDIKSFTSIAVAKMYIIQISFSKARDIYCSEVMSEYSEEIITKTSEEWNCQKVMHIIQLSHVLQGEIAQVFFVFLLNTMV